MMERREACSMMELREARSTDAPNIVLWFPTRAETLLWAGANAPDPLTSTWVIEEFGKYRHWVWVDGNREIMGIFALVFREEGHMRLARFALSPKIRGQRLAIGFLQEIITLARSLGAKQLSLNVYGSNRVARRAYESVGFQISSERVAKEDSSGVNYQMALSL
jgi:GNAT superfamily N-acetyltransferase